MQALDGKVLLVDDDPEWLDFLEEKLEESGIITFRAKNGLEAVELLKKARFDLVITDTNMPYMDGVSLLIFIRAAFGALPVIIFFSGLFGTDLSRETLEKKRPSAVLDKADAVTQLVPLVQEFLLRHRTREAMG